MRVKIEKDEVYHIEASLTKAEAVTLFEDLYTVNKSPDGLRGPLASAILDKEANHQDRLVLFSRIKDGEILGESY